MRDPTIEAIEAQCDAENERRAALYWECEAEVEDEELFDEATGPTH